MSVHRKAFQMAYGKGAKSIKRRHRNGAKSRKTLPLWMRSGRKIPPRGYAAEVTAKRECRNGTKSRKMLPLWMRSREAIPPRSYAAGVTAKRRHRNGTKSQKTLPLRYGPRYEPCRCAEIRGGHAGNQRWATAANHSPRRIPLSPTT